MFRKLFSPMVLLVASACGNVSSQASDAGTSDAGSDAGCDAGALADAGALSSNPNWDAYRCGNCADVMARLYRTVEEDLPNTYAKGCAADADCALVARNLSCLEGCSVPSTSANTAAVQAQLSRLQQNVCSRLSACQSAGDCPYQAVRCASNRCVRYVDGGI